MKTQKDITDLICKLARKVASKKIKYKEASETLLSLDCSDIETDFTSKILRLIEVHSELLSYYLIPLLELTLDLTKILSATELTENINKIELKIAEKLFQTGRSFYLSDIWKESLYLFNRSMVLFEKNGFIVDAATCKFNCAKALRKLGYRKKALVLDKEAKKIYLKEGLKFNAAECDLDSANALFELGEHIEAIRYYDEAREVFIQYGNQIEVAKCDLNSANNYCMLGQYGKSLSVYEYVYKIFQKYGMEVEAAKCRLNLANALAELGKRKRALLLYEEAKEIFLKNGVESEAARCDQNILITIRELKDSGDTSIFH